MSSFVEERKVFMTRTEPYIVSVEDFLEDDVDGPSVAVHITSVIQVHEGWSRVGGNSECQRLGSVWVRGSNVSDHSSWKKKSITKTEEEITQLSFAISVIK